MNFFRRHTRILNQLSKREQNETRAPDDIELIKSSNLFDADYYLDEYPDVKNAKIDPLVHFVSGGWRERRNPNPFFDTHWYLATYSDVADADINPLVHFLKFGLIEGRRPNCVFDGKWYKDRNAIPTGIEAFAHYVQFGSKADLDPGPFFNVSAYRMRYLAGLESTLHPVRHFLRDLRQNLNLPSPHLGRDLIRVEDLATDSFSSAPQSLPTIAVQIHVFYPDYVDVIAKELNYITIPFDLFITTDTIEKKHLIEAGLSGVPLCNRIRVDVAINRGRDIAPFILDHGKAISQYDLVLHLHSKQSPHNVNLKGWGTYLFNALLGSKENFANIVRYFAHNPKAGILYPATYFPVRPFMRLGGNLDGIGKVGALAGFDLGAIDQFMFNFFPSGSMFWARGAVINSITRMNLTLSDFESERGQDDGTLAHAIERCLPAFAHKQDMDAIAFVPNFRDYHPWLGLLNGENYRFSADIVMIDHNIGGGTNKFTSQIIEEYTSSGKSVIRIYFDHRESIFILHCIDQNSSKFYSIPARGGLYEFLTSTRCAEIVINSLYDVVSFTEIIFAVVRLRQERNVFVRYLVHDFHLICPSQHLLNAENAYCGVPPLASEECARCFSSNNNISEKARSAGSLIDWRRQSQAILDICDEVRLFDQSGLDIIRSGLRLSERQFTVIPHRPLNQIDPIRIVKGDVPHIAFFGTVTHTKGAKRLNGLANYIRENALGWKITVVGGSVHELDSLITVTGPYNSSDLSTMISSCGINVAFLSSIVPETFSYTLTEAMQMGLPLVVFDLGAQAARAKNYEHSRIIPLSRPESDVAAAIEELWQTLP